jgi:hypothetical protein
VQAQRYPILAEYCEALRQAIFFQRLMRLQQHLRGRCTYEPDRRRTPKSRPTAECYFLWERLDHVRITWRKGAEVGPPLEQATLTAAHKQELFDLLKGREHLDLSKQRDWQLVQKALALPEATDYFYLLGGPGNKLEGRRTLARIRQHRDGDNPKKKGWSPFEALMQQGRDHLERLWNLLYSTEKPMSWPRSCRKRRSILRPSKLSG